VSRLPVARIRAPDHRGDRTPPVRSGRGTRFDIVLSHAGEDSHADHRAAHEATLSAVRDFHGSVLLYQSPSTKPNGFHPTFFVELDPDAVARKDAAIQAHVSQRDKAYMRSPRRRGMAGTWAIFLRLPDES